MKYLRVLKNYFFVFVGALLFGLAAVKLKSARRAEHKANNKLRELQEAEIDEFDKKIEKSVKKVRRSTERSVKRKENALKKLDQISDNSNSVRSLLDEYNSKRV